MVVGDDAARFCEAIGAGLNSLWKGILEFAQCLDGCNVIYASQV